MERGREHSPDVIGGTWLVAAQQGAETCTALYTDGGRGVDHDTRADVSTVVEEFYIQLAVAGLCCAEVKLNLELFGMRNNTLGLGIVVRIAVGEGEYAIAEDNRTQTGDI